MIRKRYSLSIIISIAVHLVFALIATLVAQKFSVENLDTSIQIAIISVPDFVPRKITQRKRDLYFRRELSHFPIESRSHFSTPRPRETQIPKSHISDLSETVTVDLTAQPIIETAIYSALETGPDRDSIFNGTERSKTEIFRSQTIRSPKIRPTINREKLDLTTIENLSPPHLALIQIARKISAKSAEKIDIVFLIDASQSMANDIRAVNRHLNTMTDLLQKKEIDFTLGVIVFRSHRGYGIIGWDFEVTPQTTSPDQIRKVLDGVACRGGEKALDAVFKAIDEVKFRPNAQRSFILITDEYLSGDQTVGSVFRKLKSAKIGMSILGKEEGGQKFLARQTGGLWLSIESLKY